MLDFGPASLDAAFSTSQNILIPQKDLLNSKKQLWFIDSVPTASRGFDVCMLGLAGCHMQLPKQNVAMISRSDFFR